MNRRAGCSRADDDVKHEEHEELKDHEEIVQLGEREITSCVPVFSPRIKIRMVIVYASRGMAADRISSWRIRGCMKRGRGRLRPNSWIKEL